MPKDNEVDEKVMPVAWQWLDTSNFRKNIPSAAIREHWNPLYSAATVAELLAEARAEVKRLNIVLDGWVSLASQRYLRAEAAERRVAKLEAALRDLISVADPVALAPREYERIREQTARGTRISIDPFPLLKCRYEDVVGLTDGLKRARATLTGADPT